MNLHLLLIVGFIICEGLAALGVATRVNLEAAGLLLFGLSLVV